MRAIHYPSGGDLPASGYLLIEPGNLDSGLFGPAPPMYRCTPATLSNADELTPRLIDLASLSPQQQEQMAQALWREGLGDRPPAVCAWLTCAREIAELARHIGRFLVGPGIDDSPVYWRYHDPRVFSLALDVLAPAQRAALLGPVTEWRFPWCGRWWSVDGPGRDIELLEGIAPAWPNKAQWSRLRDSELVARALAQLLDVPKPPEPDDCLRYQNLAALAIQEGRERLKLADAEDLLEYAVLRARYGDAFRDHPKLAAAWSALPVYAMHWCDVRDLLSENDLRKMDAQVQQLSLLGVTQ